MKKISLSEMQAIKGGCNEVCECIIAFMDYAGWDFDKAFQYCDKVVFGPPE